MTIRILLVDDQNLIRRALELLLADEQSMEIVGEADSGEAAIAQVEKFQPDVVLMDILMPGIGGVEATKEICQRFPHTKVLVLTIDDNDDNVAQALKFGAAGYLMKNTPKEELAIAIQVVHKGYTHLGPGLGERIIAKIPTPKAIPTSSLEQLTPREQKIVELISQGANNREIAQVLCISEKTVKNHITNILSRLNLRDRTQVAIYAHSQL